MVRLSAYQLNKLHLVGAECHDSSDFADRWDLDAVKLFVCLPSVQAIEQVLQIDHQVKPDSPLYKAVWYDGMRICDINLREDIVSTAGNYKFSPVLKLFLDFIIKITLFKSKTVNSMLKSSVSGNIIWNSRAWLSMLTFDYCILNDPVNSALPEVDV